jgi:hypothetical protein
MGLPFFGIVSGELSGRLGGRYQILIWMLGQREGGCKRMGARGRVEKMPEAAAKVVVWWCGVVLAAAAEVSGAVGGLDLGGRPQRSKGSKGKLHVV